MDDNLQVKRFLRTGNTDPRNLQDLLDEAGSLLDEANSHDIVGEVVFEGTDGKYYVGTVEFCIGEINPDYLQNILNEDAMEEGDSQGAQHGRQQCRAVEVVFWNKVRDERIFTQCDEWLELLSHHELRILLQNRVEAGRIREDCYHYCLSSLSRPQIQQFDDNLDHDGIDCPVITINMDQLRHWSSVNRPQLWVEAVA